MTDIKPANGGNRLTGAAIMSQAAGHRPASEATTIEQSRAIAQVQGALIVAQQRPRDQIGAMARVREACEIEELAAHAFFSYERAGSKITGPSIHLATELARCWGNVDYGISELRRDEARGESEMLGYSWDLETNTRVTNSFIVPHKRDKRGGAVPLIDMRDIYENNANHAARRLRECIFRVLPKYVVEEAKRICHETLQHGGGEPIAERREKVIKAFHQIGVSRRQIEKRIGVAADKLTPVDIANLRIVFGSIQRGEVDKAEEFPPDQGEEIAKAVKGKTKQEPEPKQAPEPAPSAAQEPKAEQQAPAVTKAQAQAICSAFDEAQTPDDYWDALSEHQSTLNALQQRNGQSWATVDKHMLDARKRLGMEVEPRNPITAAVDNEGMEPAEWSEGDDQQERMPV